MELVEEVRDKIVELPGHAMAIYEQGEVGKFLATASGNGVPNVVLIVSQTPVDPGKIAFGEFMMVKTMANLAENPRVASIALTPRLEMAGFKAVLDYWTESGPYVDRINSIDFFRYNAYAGIHNVAVANITEILPLPERVSFLSVGAEFAAMRTAGWLGRGESAGRVETPLPIRRKFNSIMSIKVIAFLDEDGFPNVAPTFGVLFRSPNQLRFKVSNYNDILRKLEPGDRLALNVLTLDLMSYQVKGRLEGFESHLGMEVGIVRIEEAYSCVPPLVGERIV